MAMSREKVDAIRRDLEMYQKQWHTMLWMEMTAPWGPISPSSSERETLLSKGVFVEAATVAFMTEGAEGASWTVKASWSSWDGEEAFLRNVQAGGQGEGARRKYGARGDD